MTSPALDGVAAEHRSHANADVSPQPAPFLVLANLGSRCTALAIGTDDAAGAHRNWIANARNVANPLAGPTVTYQAKAIVRTKHSERPYSGRKRPHAASSCRWSSDCHYPDLEAVSG
jgi:hypothetical protein